MTFSHITQFGNFIFLPILELCQFGFIEFLGVLCNLSCEVTLFGSFFLLLALCTVVVTHFEFDLLTRITFSNHCLVPHLHCYGWQIANRCLDGSNVHNLNVPDMLRHMGECSILVHVLLSADAVPEFGSYAALIGYPIVSAWARLISIIAIFRRRSFRLNNYKFQTGHSLSRRCLWCFSRLWLRLFFIRFGWQSWSISMRTILL